MSDTTMSDATNDGSTAQDSVEIGQARRLDRAAEGLPPAPIRAVHLGVGNFFRAHQAYYTEMSNAEKSNAETSGPGSEQEWGYAAFTGRSAAIADELAPQDGLYTLIISTRTAPTTW